MVAGADYRLDWHREFTLIEPFLAGRGGVVYLEYRSEDAAPAKFGHLLKEEFARRGDGSRLSIRVDTEWFSTRRVDGVLDELDRLLTAAGHNPDLPDDMPVNIMSNLEVGGGVTASIDNLKIFYGREWSGRAFRARADAVFAAVRAHSEGGGRLMVVLNDMPAAKQADFWHRIWDAGLRAAGGDRVLLVVHFGPSSGQQVHQDCPPADLRLILPDVVEDGSVRDGQFYDDLLDAFARAGLDDPCVPAGVHLENNRHSILQLNAKLSAAIMAATGARARR